MSKESISFTKTITKTNVTAPFQLPLPSEFCDLHMPCHNVDVVLMDESEREYSVKLLRSHKKLGNGWREFAIAHGLVERDILSFHLIDSCRFKVHITKASSFTDNEFQNNVPVSLGKRKNLTEENTCCFGNTVTKKYQASFVEMQDRMLSQIKKREHEEVVSKAKVYNKSPHRSTETICKDGNQSLNLPDCSNDDEHTRIMRKELHTMDVHATQLLESGCNSTPLACVGNSESDLKLKGFEDFKICVNGVVLDSEIPLDIRKKYYQLCCGQKKLIHGHVMKSLTSKLVVAMILEIVRITDATKCASISTSAQDLENMEKTLKSFEDSGMAVGSLRAKIGTLVSFLSTHLTVEESARMKLVEIEMERKALREKKSELDDLMESILVHGELIEELETKLDALEEKKEKLCFVFKKVAGLTW